MRQEPELAERIGRVTRKLARAAAMPGEPVMFGVGSHRFQLGPPLSEDEVVAFERRHGVTLPADYRRFLTEIGHGGPGPYGGAGPGYGLLPLDGWNEALWVAEDDVLATPFPAEPGRGYRDWWAEVGLSDDDEPYRGVLALGHEGCGHFSVLVVTGAARGRVCSVPVHSSPSFSPDPDFLSWYERWLDAVLAGEQGFR